jgi:hypothetical protein
MTSEQTARRTGADGAVELADDVAVSVRDLVKTFPVGSGLLSRSSDVVSAVAGVSFDIVRGTTLGFAGTTEVEATTVPGETGSILYSGTLTLSRNLRADLTGTAALGAEYRRYSGAGEHDLTLFGEASLTWWLNRHAGVTGRLRHEEFRSSAPDRDARATSVFMGMRFQR